jgi:ABC-type Fe3+ transport system substrate-binding protein
MVNPFQQNYGITVEYFSERGPGIGPRLSAERGAGLYSWDLVVTGTTTALNSLIPAGMLDPIEPVDPARRERPQALARRRT